MIKNTKETSEKLRKTENNTEKHVKTLEMLSFAGNCQTVNVLLGNQMKYGHRKPVKSTLTSMKTSDNLSDLPKHISNLSNLHAILFHISGHMKKERNNEKY